MRRERFWRARARAWRSASILRFGTKSFRYRDSIRLSPHRRRSKWGEEGDVFVSTVYGGGCSSEIVADESVAPNTLVINARCSGLADGIVVSKPACLFTRRRCTARIRPRSSAAWRSA